MTSDPSEWTDSLETGHAEMDEQHRQLLVAHGTALRQARSGDREATRVSLRQLLETTRQHFAFEERLMVESGYAARGLHAKAHVAFVRDLLALVEEAERDSGSSLVRLWLESRYDSWWRHHVRANDVLLATYLAGAPSVRTAAAGRR